MNRYDQALRDTIELVERGPFFKPNGAPPAHRPVDDPDDALAALLDAGKAREDARIAITRAAVAAGERDQMMDLDEQVGDALAKLLEKKLPPRYRDALDEIVADLTWWVLGRAFATETLLESAWEAYRAGYLPCGYRGKYPRGTLLVHSPR